MPEIMDDERPITLIAPMASKRERKCNVNSHVPNSFSDHPCSDYTHRWAVWKIIVFLGDDEFPEPDIYYACNKGAVLLLEQVLKDMTEAARA
jgi:hypothetical protein